MGMGILKWRDGKPKEAADEYAVRDQKGGRGDMPTPKVELAKEIADVIGGPLLAMIESRLNPGDQTAFIAAKRVDPMAVLADPASAKHEDIAVIAVTIPAAAKSISDMPDELDGKMYPGCADVLNEIIESVNPKALPALRATFLWADSRPLRGAFPLLSEATSLIAMYEPEAVKTLDADVVAQLKAFALATTAFGAYADIDALTPTVMPDWVCLHDFATKLMAYSHNKNKETS